MLKKANIQWSAKQLVRSIEKGNIRFDSSVQRGYVWDQSRKSLLIHSMIEGYPIPPFYSAKDEKVYQFLDGKQRSEAMSSYINNKFELTGVPEVTLESEETMEINGLTFEKLPEELQDKIKDYSLTIYYFDGITDEEINELFFRLNNGKALSAIELTRVKAKSIDTIREIGKHQIFNSALTEKALNRYTNEDIVIKSWAILFTENPNFETKQIRPLLASAEITEQQAQTIMTVYDKIMETYSTLINTIDKQDRKIAKRILTRTHLVSIIPTVAKLIENETWDTEQFTGWVRHFFAGTRSATISDSYNEAARNGSGKTESIKKRLEIIKNDFTEFIFTGKAKTIKEQSKQKESESVQEDQEGQDEQKQERILTLVQNQSEQQSEAV
jgi:hypothetical protein